MRFSSPEGLRSLDGSEVKSPRGSRAQIGFQLLLEAPVHLLGLEPSWIDQPLEAEAEEGSAELDRLGVGVGIGANRPRSDALLEDAPDPIPVAEQVLDGCVAHR